MIMNLPTWYVECVEDHLSILRSSQDYTQTELFEATKNQRLAEYKLMRERMSVDENSDMSSVPSATPVPVVKLQQYDSSIMSLGHFKANRSKSSTTTTGFWENILK